MLGSLPARVRELYGLPYTPHATRRLRRRARLRALRAHARAALAHPRLLHPRVRDGRRHRAPPDRTRPAHAPARPTDTALSVRGEVGASAVVSGGGEVGASASVSAQAGEVGASAACQRRRARWARGSCAGGRGGRECSPCQRSRARRRSVACLAGARAVRRQRHVVGAEVGPVVEDRHRPLGRLGVRDRPAHGRLEHLARRSAPSATPSPRASAPSSCPPGSAAPRAAPARR